MIHLRINALGLPIEVAPTGGETSDFKGHLPVMDADGPAPKVLKNARRLAIRYDNTADSCLGFIHNVSIRLWTRQFGNTFDSGLTGTKEPGWGFPADL